MTSKILDDAAKQLMYSERGIITSNNYKVRNVPESSEAPQCPLCGSWINHWKEGTKTRPEECVTRMCECKLPDIEKDGKPVGGHVIITEPNSKTGVYIIPICKTTNHSTNDTSFYIKNGTRLVPVDWCKKEREKIEESICAEINRKKGSIEARLLLAEATSMIANSNMPMSESENAKEIAVNLLQRVNKRAFQ